MSYMAYHLEPALRTYLFGSVIFDRQETTEYFIRKHWLESPNVLEIQLILHWYSKTLLLSQKSS